MLQADVSLSCSAGGAVLGIQSITQPVHSNKWYQRHSVTLSGDKQGFSKVCWYSSAFLWVT